MKINWREVFKFLCGATFVGTFVNLFLWANNVSLPFLGMTLEPWLFGVRGVVGIFLCGLFWWLGWGRKS